MNLAAMRNVVTGKLGLKLLAGKKYAPVILFGLGAVGVVTATVLACRATLKVEAVLDEVDENIKEMKNLRDGDLDEYDQKAYNKDVSKLYFHAGVKIARMYAPSVLLMAGSIAALTGSHVMLTNRYASAAAAYTALDNGFKAYRKRVVEKLGAEQDLEFRHGVEEIEIVEEASDGSGPIVKTVKRAAPGDQYSIYAKWFNESCSPWRSEAALNYVFLKAQQDHWNWRLQHKGYVMLNEVYEGLGMPLSAAGQLVGWTKDAHERFDKYGNPLGDGYIDFGIFGDDVPEAAKDFVNGWNKSVKIDPNVDGLMYTKIDKFEPEG